MVPLPRADRRLVRSAPIGGRREATRDGRHAHRATLILVRVLAGPLVLIGAIWGSAWANGEENLSPFVSGFERFGRHDLLTPSAAGRLLADELSCTACHPSRRNAGHAKLGPRLDGVGNRVRAAWLRAFLDSPSHAKPGTTMPDLLKGLDRGERARTVGALTAFLGSLQEPFPELKASGANPLPYQFWNKGDGKAGRILYHRVGCVACHEPDAEYDDTHRVVSAYDRLLSQLDPEEIEAMGLAAALRPVPSVPLPQLSEKYTRRSLTFFLLDPYRVRPGARMPNLKLSPTEAADIAAYLVPMPDASDDVEEGVSDAPSEVIDAGRVEEGRRLFVQLKCVQCHAVERVKDKGAGSAKHFEELDFNAETSCVGSPRPGLPHYALDAQQIDALQTARFDGSEASLTSADYRILQLNCLACHERDHRGGVGRNRQAYFVTVEHADLGDEGRLPPPLTGVGGKLRPNWLRKVLSGTGAVRPYLSVRMPVYPDDEARQLVEFLRRADKPLTSHTWPVPSSENEKQAWVEAGRQLLDTGCVQCHPLREESLPGVLGIDLAGVTERLEPAWFESFLLDPGRLKPRTRMPTFFPNGKATNEDVLHGNVARQIAAIWLYLQGAATYPLPSKIAEARAMLFELTPQDKPILLRTFMREGGTRAIAVGFPAQVHFAFDAEQLRLAVVWRGRFLDAQGTWFDRFAPPAIPLGDHVMTFPSGPSFASLDHGSDDWPSAEGAMQSMRFEGYRLDGDRIPTFLYRVGDWEIEDRITPSEAQGLRRRWTLRAANDTARPLWLRLHAGASLSSTGEGRWTDERGVTVIVPPAPAGAVVVHHGEDESDLRLPIRRDTSLEMEYRW